MFRSICIPAVFILFVILIGCSESTDVNTPELGNSLAIVQESPEFRQLVRIGNELVSRALNRNIDGCELAEIIECNDNSRFAAVLGYSAEEYSALGKKIEKLAESLRTKYPDLCQNREDLTVCPTCDIEAFIAKWDTYNRRTKPRLPLGGDDDSVQIPLPGPEDKGMSCQWAPYTAALVLCAATANPVLYFACSIVALCTFCSGGWVTTFCG